MALPHEDFVLLGLLNPLAQLRVGNGNNIQLPGGSGTIRRPAAGGSPPARVPDGDNALAEDILQAVEGSEPPEKLRVVIHDDIMDIHARLAVFITSLPKKMGVGADVHVVQRARAVPHEHQIPLVRHGQGLQHLRHCAGPHT